MANPRVYTKLIPCKGPHCTHLRVELYYSLGGMNYWTYKVDARGYYLSVTPIERGERGTGFMCESFRMGSGVKKLIKEVSRQSKSAADSAAALAKEEEASLIQYVCQCEGLEVIENG